MRDRNGKNGRPPSAAEATEPGRTEQGKETRSAGEETEPGRDDRRAGAGDRVAAGYRRAEEKNRAARASLTPLAPGRRPGPVTAGAVISGLIALVFWASVFVAIFTEATVEGSRPEPFSLAIFAGVMTVMAVGMWKAKYWAALGFQMLLVLFLLAAVLGLVSAESWLQAGATAVLIAGFGFLFYKMVKALARLQMPERPGAGDR